MRKSDAEEKRMGAEIEMHAKYLYARRPNV